MKTKLLLLLVLANFSIYAQTNLVPNGDFETWSSSSQPYRWFPFISGIVSQSTTAQNGSSSTNMMVASGTFNFINSEYFPVTANKTYRVTMYHKLVKGTFSKLDFSVYHKPGTFKEEITKKTETVFSTSNWTKVEFTYTPTVSENIEVDIWATGTIDSEILVDNVSVVDVDEAPAQYTMIPDANFEKKLIALGIDSGTVDGKVLTNNVNKVTSLNLTSSSVADLTGIEDFVALTSLDLYSNKLTSLDVSKNTALKSLNCGWNAIPTLDVSKNVALTTLSCYSNKLTILDVSKNINLLSLACDQNELTSLDISKNVKLNGLSCVSNKLTTLDTSNNPDLTVIECYQNKITDLDVSKNTKLYRFECFSNQLTTLDVSKNLTLNSLVCYSNKFTALDLSKNVALNKLDCSYNSYLKEVNLKNGKNALLDPSKLDFTKNPSLTCILVDNVAYAETNFAAKKETSVYFSETPCAAPKYTLIPDLNFEKSLISKGLDGFEDGQVLTQRISDVKVLALNGYYGDLPIEDYTGIEDFAALEELELSGNRTVSVKKLDVSKNQLLKKLNTSQASLGTLDVSKNLALTDLNCYGAKLTTLDVSKNVELKSLTCSYNRLTTLDVTQNVKLTSLFCSAANVENNYSLQQGLLTSLDLSKNLALEMLDCSWNDKLVGLDVTKNTQLTFISVENNKLTTIDFSANKLLKQIICASNKLTTIDLSKYPNLEKIDCSNNLLTVLDVTQKPALKSLRCSSNSLTVLDVSKNPLLEDIYCGNNKLTNLDISANPNIRQLLCSGNDLIKLNLKNGNNTKFSTEYQSQFSNNKNLACILVDDVAYANSKWSTFKDSWASFNTECTFSLPSKNFAIESKGETCAGENNGQITIIATAQLPYTATVNGIAKTFSSSTLQMTNLAPGTYAVVIAVPGEVYEQTFNIAIPKAATVTAKSTIASKKIEVEITAGTAPYTVFVDGTEQFQTTDSNFSLELNKEALVEVATSKACEGVFAKKVSSYELGTILSAYPNPTTDIIEIEIPNSKSEAVIEIYNFGGQIVSKGTYNTENGKASLSLANLPSGIYAAKIYLETPEYVKIIKK